MREHIFRAKNRWVPQVREANLGLFAYTLDNVCAVLRSWPSTAAYCVSAACSAPEVIPVGFLYVGM